MAKTFNFTLAFLLFTPIAIVIAAQAAHHRLVIVA